FSGKEIVDFSTLGESSLFLIDGPTGAGKSSILHAICYALYGETTDSDRKELGLRCDYAKADVLTELSLEFSIRGDRYRITRVPTQMRPAKRGGGETEQKPTAHLRRVLENGEEETLVAKKTRDADSKIEEIVGLTPEQFLQVMVLPQGKFRELLLAKSDDRQAILSTLFQTEIYKRIEQLLKDKSAAIEKQNQTFEDRKNDAFADVDVVNSEALEKSIEEAVGLLDAKQQEKEQVAVKKQSAVTSLETAEALGKSFDSQKSKQKELESYLQKADEIKADKICIERAGKAASITPKWHALQAILKDIKDKQEAIAQTETNKENAGLRVSKANNAVEQANEEYKQRDTLKA
ncbi:MAG: SMC family ATPase, partial [Methyloprofundus sp.]|nr:SMC family ATPase [Methyloprofundus sp.]